MEKYFLTSERLGFREFTPSDFHDVLEMFSDPEVMKYYTSLYTKQMTATWLERTFARYKNDGHSIWAVELLKDGSFIGGIGLAMQNVDGENKTEVGYMLKRAYWGHGFAVEGAAAVRDYAFETLKKDHLISLIYPKNSASLQVALKIGMQKTRSIDFNGRQHDFFEIFTK